MLVGCCVKCKHLELVESGSENICPQCGGMIVSLGVDANKWNNMGNDEMLSLIESTVNKAQTPIKPVLVQPVFEKTEEASEGIELKVDPEEERNGLEFFGTREATSTRTKRVDTGKTNRSPRNAKKTGYSESRRRLPLVLGIIAAVIIALGAVGFFLYSKFGYVEVTLPKQFVENTSAEDLTAALPDDIKVVKNDDGSATYRIPKSKHKELMKELDDTIEQGLAEMTSSPDALFTSITHNSDYTEFKATCKTDSVGLFQSISCLALYYCGGFYNVFNGTPVDNIKVVFLDPSGNVISEANSKDMGGNNDSNGSVPVDNTTTSSDSTASSSVDSTGSDSEDSTEATELTIEQVDAKCVVFNGYFGNPTVSAYVAFKNTSDRPIKLTNVTIDYEDDNGKLISTETMPNCIPEAIKPGQIGYLYSYHHDLTDVDLSNGLSFKPNASVVEANGFYEIEVSDVSVKTSNNLMYVNVIGRGTNNTGEEQSLAEPGAVFFDKDNNVVGFCFGMETFPAGQTKSFEISGDMLSEDYDKSIVDHVEVYIQGSSLW